MVSTMARWTASPIAARYDADFPSRREIRTRGMVLLLFLFSGRALEEVDERPGDDTRGAGQPDLARAAGGVDLRRLRGADVVGLLLHRGGGHLGHEPDAI